MRKTLSRILMREGEQFLPDETGSRPANSTITLGKIAKLREDDKVKALDLVGKNSGPNRDFVVMLNEIMPYKEVDKLLKFYHISTADAVWTSMPGVLKYTLPTTKPEIFLYVDSVTGRETR